MTLRFRSASILAAALWLAGCGYVGDALPPSLAIPAPITDLRVFERGDKLIVDFTVPALATDEAPLRRVRDVEVQIGAQLVEAGVKEIAPAHLEIPAGPWIGQDVVIAARAVSRKGRAGAWSNQVRLRIVEPLETPADLKAQGTPRGVEVTWPAPQRQGVVWRVLRQGPGQPAPELAGVAEKPAYLDAAAQYGARYQYIAQAFMKAGDAEAVSELSEAVAIEYEDRFPPATPAGLSALAGLDSIQLTWNPDSEPDLRGYHLYRAEGDGAFARVGGVLDAPAYTDRAVTAERRYRYAVSAVDQKGNEGARSEPVEITAQ